MTCHHGLKIADRDALIVDTVNRVSWNRQCPLCIAEHDCIDHSRNIRGWLNYGKKHGLGRAYLKIVLTSMELGIAGFDVLENIQHPV